MKLLRHRASDEIPTSPMADIAFLLIIYFMLTITLSVGKGLDYALPEDEPGPLLVDPVESVLVEVLPWRISSATCGRSSRRTRTNPSSCTPSPRPATAR